MAKLDTVSLALTTVADEATPFSNEELYVVDGIFTVSTAALSVGAIQGAAFTSFASGTQFGVKLVNLRQVLVKPTVAGVHGTLTIFGTVVDAAGLKELLASKLGAT